MLKLLTPGLCLAHGIDLRTSQKAPNRGVNLRCGLTGTHFRRVDAHPKLLSISTPRASVDDDGARLGRRFGFRAAYVFDIAQTDGEPLPEPCEASGDPGATTLALRQASLERGVAIESVDDLGGALGISSGGCIRLLAGLSPAMEFTTLVHEYAHELLHHVDDRPISRDTLELEAEAVAFVVGGPVGLDGKRLTRLHSSKSRRSRGAREFAGSHSAYRVDDSGDASFRRLEPLNRCDGPQSLSVSGVRSREGQHTRTDGGCAAGCRSLHSRAEFAGLAGLSLNCPQCGQPLRYLPARTPEG